MRPAALKFALLCLAASAAGPLAAGQDWAQRKAVRVSEPGQGVASLGFTHSVQQSWALGERFAYLRESNGTFKIQRSMRLALGLGWQFDAGWGLKLDLPYHLAEFSNFPPAGTTLNFRLDDPSLRRTDSLGDVSLEVRRAFGAEPSQPGASAALWFKASGPSGIGPFEAPHTMAATGQGRWILEPGLVTGVVLGDWDLGLQLGLPVQLGRESTLSSEAALGFGPSGPQLPVGGNVWLGPRYGVEGSLALGWNWHVDQDSRQTLGLELQAWQRSPLDQGGVLTPDTEQLGLRCIPQLLADFGRFRALAAWELPFLYANNEAASDFGASQIRIDYGF